jgi:hypothetical protein
LSRAETLKVLFIAQKQTAQFHPTYTFKDIANTDWYAPYVSTAKRLGYISRFENQFSPNTPILRAEFLQILLKMKQISSQYNETYTYQDIGPSDWYTPYVSTAKRLGYISASQKNFSPNATITRAEAAKLISNIFQIK